MRHLLCNLLALVTRNTTVKTCGKVRCVTLLFHHGMASLLVRALLDAAGMGRARGPQAAPPPAPGELRQSVRVGKLNLVDLAGSERVHITGATGVPHTRQADVALKGNHLLHRGIEST